MLRALSESRHSYPRLACFEPASLESKQLSTSATPLRTVANAGTLPYVNHRIFQGGAICTIEFYLKLLGYCRVQLVAMASQAAQIADTIIGMKKAAKRKAFGKTPH